MDYTKEIRSDDKKRGAAPAGGRAALWSATGWLAAACLSGVAGDARREGPPPWLVVLSMSASGRGDGLPGMDGAGNDPAAIRRYLISN